MMENVEVTLLTVEETAQATLIPPKLEETAATSVRSPSSQASVENESPTRRLLKRGDLVRSIWKSESRLGRVIRCIPVESEPQTNEELHHPFRYDVEWVLGGRSTGMHRAELDYTTADAEGMTDNSNRSRRKRKPNTFLEDTSLELPKKKASMEKKANVEGKKKATAASKSKKGKVGDKKLNAANGTKKAQKSKVSASAKDAKQNKGTTGSKRKVSELTTTSLNGAKQKKAKGNAESQRDTCVAADSSSTYVALDLYERHRREFERLVTRLEKVDIYGFFHGDPPSEFDEKYYPTSPQSLSSESNGEIRNGVHCDTGDLNTFADTVTTADTITTAAMAACSDVLKHVGDMPNPNGDHIQEVNIANGNTTTPQEPQEVDQEKELKTTETAGGVEKVKKNGKRQPVLQATFPSHPPYNWKMVRRRMEHGRYILDREYQEEEVRYQQLAAYYKSVGLRRKRPTIKKGNAATSRKKKVNPRVLHPLGVHWELFVQDVSGMCDTAVARESSLVTGRPGTILSTAIKIKEAAEQALERTGRRHMTEMSLADARHKFTASLKASLNQEAAMQGKWRKVPFPERKYERLKKDVVCHGLSELDEMIATYELRTNLPDSFVGLSYGFNDTHQSELWMTSILDKTTGANRLKNNSEKSEDEERETALALAKDDGVVRAQVKATMQSLLIAVQDRVLTERNVLHQSELRSANWADSVGPEGVKSSGEVGVKHNPELVEQPVWGIDCYTRRNILICLEVDFDAKTALTFVEKWLLPAVNACPVDLAYNIANAARILEGLPLESETPSEQVDAKTYPQIDCSIRHSAQEWSHSLLGKALLNKIKSCGPTWLPCAARQVRLAYESLGPDFFRVHPKGHGSVVLTQKIEANTLITFYRGEVYPSWRWGEKMDAIEITQQRKGLKPALPDFYNMALERPQSDPRGYGLLFVDASRKAGHGSSLSHSCEPTCEVRVAAVNGELCLAMTTIRALEMGEELTFDYNAVTESLNEYRSAVCLCGHGKCRGSFLHFATADCYQQVLNRNAPIATRFANLVKSCMKKVMSEEDERILKNHGFGTASFGAISVDRRKLSCLNNRRGGLDSIDIVPIWLRTYVADTLRYIEYERRALPVALLCNHLSKAKASLPQKNNPIPAKNADNTKTLDAENSLPSPEPISEKAQPQPAATGEKARSLPDAIGITTSESETGIAALKPLSITNNISDVKECDASKQAKNNDQKKKSVNSRPEPTFIYFCRVMRDQFREMVEKQGNLDNASGLTLSHAITKIAGIEWNKLSDEGKLEWKERASQDWLSRGGEKRYLTKEPQERSTVKSRKPKPVPESNSDGPKGSSEISFEAADAEGLSAMEQRIQQLTQTLSRVGRVLDRHRQSICSLDSTDIPPRRSSASLRGLVHPPLAVLRDEHVIAWIWNNEDGVVRTLLRCIESQEVFDPSLNQAMRAIEEKYQSLSQFGIVDANLRLTRKDFLVAPSTGRALLNEALLQFRSLLLTVIDSICLEWRRHKGKLRREAVQKKKYEALKAATASTSEATSALDDLANHPRDAFSVVSSVLRSLVNQIAERMGEVEKTSKLTSDDLSKSAEVVANPLVSVQEDKRLLEQYNQRFRLQATADVLLMYGQTSTFFTARHYQSLVSTPIEVYARELGNSVPKSAIDKSATVQNTRNTCGNGELKYEKESEDASEVAHGKSQVCSAMKPGTSDLCDPDDIIANVAVQYDGDYVLSQLLQWYNGGIGQKQGLPDLLGCALLPTIAGCWENEPCKSKTGNYELQIRPRLKEWFENPHKRGSPFPQDMRRVFKGPSATTWFPFGTPVLDFLVTGDEGNIQTILQSLKVKDQVKENGEAPDEGLLSTVDQGMPAQAVANWVQCENPNCLKWRKLPWHVDIDMLPGNFFCKNNKWNPSLSSCEAPEEEWSERDTQIKNDGIETMMNLPSERSSPEHPKKDEPLPCTGISDVLCYSVGARLDVLRTGKKNYCVGIIVEYDAIGKRVKFHFPKTRSICDEWIDVGSSRIAPLNKKVAMQGQGKNVNKPGDISALLNPNTKKSKHSKDKSFDKSETQKPLKVNVALETGTVAEIAEQSMGSEVTASEELATTKKIKQRKEKAVVKRSKKPQDAKIAVKASMTKSADHPTERESNSKEKSALDESLTKTSTEIVPFPQAAFLATSTDESTEREFDLCAVGKCEDEKGDPIERVKEIFGSQTEPLDPISKDINNRPCIDSFRGTEAIVHSSDPAEKFTDLMLSGDGCTQNQVTGEMKKEAAACKLERVVGAVPEDPEPPALTSSADSGIGNNERNRSLPRSPQNGSTSPSRIPKKHLGCAVVLENNTVCAQAETPVAVGAQRLEDVSNLEAISSIRLPPAVDAATSRKRRLLLEPSFPVERSVVSGVIIPKKRSRQDRPPYSPVDTVCEPCKPLAQRIPRKTFHEQEAKKDYRLSRPNPQTSPVLASYVANSPQRPFGSNEGGASSSRDNKIIFPHQQRRPVYTYGFTSSSGSAEISRSDLGPVTHPSNVMGRNDAQRFRPPPRMPPPNQGFRLPNRQDHGR